MVNKPRQVGTAYENLCKEYLISQGLMVEREDFSSPRGDLRGIPVTIECKARKSLDPALFLTQVFKSDARTGHGMPVVFSKRRQSNVKDSYFLTDLEHGVKLLKAWVYCVNNNLLEEIGCQ